MTRLVIALACCATLAAFRAHADDQRARQNYLLYCSGCHGEAGHGLEGHVPSMHRTFARFAKEPRGRAYLLRVPGVTQSTLDSELLAEVMNWALRQFSAPDDASDVPSFSAAEITAARSQPLLEVVAARMALLGSLEQ